MPLGSGVLNQWGSKTAEAWQWGAGLSLHYNHRPMHLAKVSGSDTTHVGDVVPGLLRGELLGRLGVPAGLELGLALPVVSTIGTPDRGIGTLSVSDLQGTGLGDIRVALGADVSRWLDLRKDNGDGLGIGVRVVAWLPSVLADACDGGVAAGGWPLVDSARASLGQMSQHTLGRGDGATARGRAGPRTPCAGGRSMDAAAGPHLTAAQATRGAAPGGTR